MPEIEFTVITEHLFFDEKLSIEGLELLAALVRMAKNGKVMNHRDLSKTSHKCSLEACRLDELVEQGYIRYQMPTQRRGEKRQWAVHPKL